MSDDPIASEPIAIPAVLDGERIDKVVALLTGWPRAAVQALLESGEVLVDGRAVSKSHKLHEGDVVEVLGEPQPDAPPVGDPGIAFDIRYEDDDVLVIAKPAGLVVHPGAGHGGGTLVNGLLARYPEIASVGDPMRPGIVHRLDRDTSGLIVAARSEAAYRGLVTMLAAHEVERRYTALVWGQLTSPRGLVDAPIGRSQARRTRMAVRDEGKPARTEYEVKKVYDPPLCSLLECKLETGRTHQIRVHLAAIGHPVVGDATYGGHRTPVALNRPFLHAGLLAFAHPVTGAALRFEEPLTTDLDAVLRVLDAP
jgi:23S rRNA pseudouridine1911/1915/1917 synthase